VVINQTKLKTKGNTTANESIPRIHPPTFLALDAKVTNRLIVQNMHEIIEMTSNAKETFLIALYFSHCTFISALQRSSLKLISARFKFTHAASVTVLHDAVLCALT